MEKPEKIQYLDPTSSDYTKGWVGGHNDVWEGFNAYTAELMQPIEKIHDHYGDSIDLFNLSPLEVELFNIIQQTVKKWRE